MNSSDYPQFHLHMVTLNVHLRNLERISLKSKLLCFEDL